MSAELRDLAGLFLTLGVIGFGGPAAHIALMEERVVRRRGWMSREEFLELVGVVNLLPGPNSTELAIAIGYRRAGTAGLLVAGLAFILPATLMVLGCAWVYVRFGDVPALHRVWRGVQPVVVAVVFVALLGFARTAIRGARAAAAAATALLLAVAGVNELIVLLAGGLVATVLAPGGVPTGLVPLLIPVWLGVSTEMSTGRIFLSFARIGAVLYGSGYVLLVFLRSAFVEPGWLTEAQLLDAVAVGQATPGPVFTTATFVGYLLGGFGGAVAATLGIFLPAFAFVRVSEALVRRVRRSVRARAFLQGVTAASLALMAVVLWQLGTPVLGAPVAWLLVAGSVALLWSGVNSALLILAGGLAGLVLP